LVLPFQVSSCFGTSSSLLTLLLNLVLGSQRDRNPSTQSWLCPAR
jgi:hypothetical protein